MRSFNLSASMSGFSDAAILSLILGLFFSLLLDGGTISVPVMSFYFPFAAYLFVRALVEKLSKKPATDGVLEWFAVAISPIWGLLIFLPLLGLTQAAKAFFLHLKGVFIP